MATGYYLQDNPNPTTAQYGWLRTPLGQPGQHLSGVIGVHTSEAITDFEGIDNNAENNAEFIRRRADHGSYHTTGDADSILPLVHPAWAAWADTTNNAHALSVSGCLQASRWLEMTPERRRAVVVNMGIAAARMVLTAVADGYLAFPTPARRISAAEAISGSRAGFYGHGETNPGTRYDPGEHFDWDLFLSTYAAAISGTASISYQGTTNTVIEEIDMTAEQNILARLEQIVEWEDKRINHLAAQAESNRNMLAGFVRDVVVNQGNLTVEQIDAKLAEVVKPAPASQPLFKGDKDATVYAWADSSFHALTFEEYLELLSAGAVLQVLPQAVVDSTAKGA